MDTWKYLENYFPKEFLKSCHKKKLIVILGLLGDFDSFEYVHALKKKQMFNDDSDVETIIFAIGTELAKEQFCNFNDIPSKNLIVFEDNTIHKELDLDQGAKLTKSPYSNLLLMCAGFNSPGTLAEVVRGYTGDRGASEVFLDRKNIFKFFPLFNVSSFEFVFGTGYQRPLELATLRLRNMIEIISNWHIYMNTNSFLTQRGGTFLFDNKRELVYSFKSRSLLLYSDNMSIPLSFLESESN